MKANKGSVGSLGQNSQTLAVLEVVLATALFIGCVHYIRLRLPRRAKTGPAGTVGTASPSPSSDPSSPAP